MNANDARAPTLFRTNQGIIGLLAFANPGIGAPLALTNRPGCNACMDEEILDQIATLREQCDVLIVQSHSGLTNYHLPKPSCRELRHKMINAGADIVIGHHPHVIQGAENHRGKQIYHSIGNLAFAPIPLGKSNASLSQENLNSILLELRILDGRLSSTKVHHVEYAPDAGLLSMLDDQDSKLRKEFFASISSKLATSIATYHRVYTNYVITRLLKRAVWRLHPKRWRELSYKHLLAVFHGFRTR